MSWLEKATMQTAPVPLEESFAVNAFVNACDLINFYASVELEEAGMSTREGAPYSFSIGAKRDSYATTTTLPRNRTPYPPTRLVPSARGFCKSGIKVRTSPKCALAHEECIEVTRSSPTLSQHGSQKVKRSISGDFQ